MTAPTLVRPTLSHREKAVLREWLMRDSKRDAAARLFITPATLSTHISRIREKYHRCGRPALTKAALLCRALQDGLIDIDEL